MKRNGGFTLMELLIVIAIIMILAGAIVARIGTSGEKAKEAKAKAELDEIAAGCRAFYMDTGLWPIDGNALMAIVATPQGYNEAGVVTNFDASLWKGPYLEVAGTVLPNDPGGTQYEVEGDPVLPAIASKLEAKSTTPAKTLLIHRFGT